MTDQDISIPENEPSSPPVKVEDLPEVSNVEPIETVSAPRDEEEDK